MKITRVTVRQADLEYAGEAYSFSQGRRYKAFQTTVVTLETDEGIMGHGETCPCGPAYMPGYAGGVLPALAELAPAVLGCDPCEVTVVGRAMDAALLGHQFAKTAIDLACWDILGKAAGLPVHTLLGGRIVTDVPLHRVVPLGGPEETVETIQDLRRRGYLHYQVKLGHGLAQDLALMRRLHETRGAGEVYVGDANAAWRPEEAMRISAALAEVDCLLEEPCRGYEACRAVRPRLCHPMKLDESIATVSDIRRAIADDSCDAIAIKISRLGGLTPARIVRDICADAGIAITIEDTWGGSIVTAAIAHLSVSTPPEALLNATDLNNYNRTDIALDGPPIANGRMGASDRPGLGTEPDVATLGTPVAIFENT
jgi:L-alanine-DL-glutamate epimerase-like enolase superfamily enzyme